MPEEFPGSVEGGIIDVSEFSLSDLVELDASVVAQALRDVLDQKEQEITASWGSKI